MDLCSVLFMSISRLFAVEIPLLRSLSELNGLWRSSSSSSSLKFYRTSWELRIESIFDSGRESLLLFSGFN